MMPRFAILRRTTLNGLLTLAVLVAVCLAPLAALGDDEVFPDARFEGYSPPIVLKDAGGVAGSVVFLILLMAMTMGVMFINAKRSHLD